MPPRAELSDGEVFGGGDFESVRGVAVWLKRDGNHCDCRVTLCHNSVARLQVARDGPQAARAHAHERRHRCVGVRQQRQRRGPPTDDLPSSRALLVSAEPSDPRHEPHGQPVTPD
jgi:hypothetical protein